MDGKRSPLSEYGEGFGVEWPLQIGGLMEKGGVGDRRMGFMDEVTQREIDSLSCGKGWLDSYS